MSIGIYKITNLINGKIYIGQSVKIEQRWAKEKTRAFNPNEEEYKYPRSAAFRKYGLQNFSFEIIEECSIDKLNEREQYYIKYYNSLVPNGYNLTLGGSNAIGVKLDIAKVEEITILLKTTKLNNSELGHFFGVSENTICGINTGYYWKRFDIDYPIRKHSRKTQNFCLNCGTLISNTATYCVKCASLKKRTVERPPALQLAQEILNSSFCAVGRKYGVTDNAIKKWCKTYGMPTKKKEIQEWFLQQKSI